MTDLSNKVQIGFSCRDNEGSADGVWFSVIVECFQAFQRGPRRSRAAFDRPLCGQQLERIVSISDHIVAVMPSEPNLDGSEARAVWGFHYAVLHANHPTQRITLGLVPVEVAA